VRSAYRIVVEKPEGRIKVRDVGIDGKIILK
jgi:hypothetical protein